MILCKNKEGIRTYQAGCSNNIWRHGKGNTSYTSILWFLGKKSMPTEKKETNIDSGNVKDKYFPQVTRLQERKSWLSSRLKFYSRVRFLAFVAAALMSAVFFYFYKTENGFGPVSLISLIYTITPFTIVMYYRGGSRYLENELQEIGFEIDMLQFDVSIREQRAEKVLKLNNLQLQRYYDLNLNQNIWVFGLGIFCILLGIAIIGVTLYLVLKVANGLDAKIITGVVGSIGSLLSSYVAAIYLKMHAGATSHLGEFHSRLVETHQYLLGNLLASRIEDDHKRWETLSQLAINMSNGTK